MCVALELLLYFICCVTTHPNVLLCFLRTIKSILVSWCFEPTALVSCSIMIQHVAVCFHCFSGFVCLFVCFFFAVVLTVVKLKAETL